MRAFAAAAVTRSLSRRDNAEPAICDVHHLALIGVAVAHEGLSAGEVEVLVDGLTDDVAFNWVLIHLGLRGNPPDAPGPPSEAAVTAAFTSLEALVGRGLGKVGRIEHIDGGPPGRYAPVRHVEEPTPVVRQRVLEACHAGDGWEWSCWYVNTEDGDTAARHALEGKEGAEHEGQRGTDAQ